MPDQWRVKGGAAVLIGAPAKPMSEDQKVAIRQALEQRPDVLFAYAPQMYSKGYIDPPRQVLYVVLRATVRGRVEEVMQSLAPQVPPAQFIDMLPVFDDHPWLHDVIRTKCVVAVNDHIHHARCVAAAGLDPGAGGE